jgi:hypothetical protein
LLKESAINSTVQFVQISGVDAALQSFSLSREAGDRVVVLASLVFVTFT